MSMKVVFMGSPDFAVPALAALAREHQVIAVYTQPDRPAGRGMQLMPPPVKKKAIELGIPVFQPEKVSVPEEIERLKAMQTDVFVVAAYGQILKKAVLEIPRLGCFNVHASILPRWRGASPIHAALLAGDRETGVTIMRMVEKLDAGNMLGVTRTPIQSTDTIQTLHDRLAQMGGEILIQTMKQVEALWVHETRQDESQVTYAKKLTKDLEWLNPEGETAAELDRKIRALNPWPGTSVRLATGERLRLRKALLRTDLSSKPGQIYERVGMFLLSTREGSLELQRVQLDGKPEQNIGDFINGLKGKGITPPLALKGNVSS